MASLLLWIVSQIQKLLMNPVTWIVMAAIALFTAGYIERGRVIDKAVLKDDLKVIQQTEVKRANIQKRYSTIDPSTAVNIEQLLSYETSAYFSTRSTYILQDKDKP